MDLSLTAVLTIFLAGFLINRHRSVSVAVAVALALGVLVADGWMGSVVHNLVGMYQSLT